MGVYYNGKKLGQPYFNGKKMNAYFNGKKVWLGGFPKNVVVFQSDEPRTITPRYTRSTTTLQYSVDRGRSWVTIASGATTLSSQEIWMRGQATGSKSLYTADSSSNAWVFSGGSSNKLKVFGNLNFLLCDNLGDTAAPTTLGWYCYQYMFYGCTSLVQAPELPATTLAQACYNYMFRDCTWLVQAPELPATALAPSCYNRMYQGCTSLTSIVLHYRSANNPNNAFTNWVLGISTTGTLYKAGTQFTSSGNNTYPTTWTQVKI